MKAILVNGEPVDYSTLPENARDTMQRYIEQGCPTGGFLEAVLSNDLMAAASLANTQNSYLLFEYAQWLYNFAPRGCFGSPEKYQTWIDGYVQSRKTA